MHKTAGIDFLSFMKVKCLMGSSYLVARGALSTADLSFVGHVYLISFS